MTENQADTSSSIDAPPSDKNGQSSGTAHSDVAAQLAAVQTQLAAERQWSRRSPQPQHTAVRYYAAKQTLGIPIFSI